MKDLIPDSLHKDLKNKLYCQYKQFLAEAEKWSLDQIQNYQVDQLNQLLHTAITQTKGYAKLYAEHGVANLKISDISDIQKLPFVSKAVLQKNIKDFSINANSRDYVTTGGSTGIPFGFYRSKDAFAKELAAKAHQYHRVGWEEGDRQVVFRGTPIENDEKYKFYPEYNELRLSSYHLTDGKLDYYNELIREYKPHWIRCYPSSAQLLAQHLIDKKDRIEGLKGLLCASENLYEHQINLFSKAFSGKIFSHYGHYEQAVLAGFCETEHTYHVLPQYGCAELLNPNNEEVSDRGGMGEIVGTSFIMDDTLFIRYRTQDYAIYKGNNCQSCNRPYQCWERIEGRLQDWVIASDGRPVSMTAFNMHDNALDALSQFQFEQHERGTLKFKILPRHKLSSTDVEKILSSVNKRLGQGFIITPEIVSEIPITTRGKHRFLNQFLPLSFGDQGIQTLFGKNKR